MDGFRDKKLLPFLRVNITPRNLLHIDMLTIIGEKLYGYCKRLGYDTVSNVYPSLQRKTVLNVLLMIIESLKTPNHFERFLLVYP